MSELKGTLLSLPCVVRRGHCGYPPCPDMPARRTWSVVNQGLDLGHALLAVVGRLDADHRLAPDVPAFDAAGFQRARGKAIRANISGTSMMLATWGSSSLP